MPPSRTPMTLSKTDSYKTSTRVCFPPSKFPSNPTTPLLDSARKLSPGSTGKSGKSSPKKPLTISTLKYLKIPLSFTLTFTNAWTLWFPSTMTHFVFSKVKKFLDSKPQVQNKKTSFTTNTINTKMISWWELKQATLTKKCSYSKTIKLSFLKCVSKNY